jgi:uncharacterized membrane protein YeiB
LSIVPTRRAQRLKVAVQLSATVTFLLLFGQVFTGMCVQSFSSTAMLYGEEPFMAAMLEYSGLIHGFHRWAGPVMALASVVTGLSMIMLQRESRSLVSRILVPLGVVVLVLSLFSMTYAHVTGLVAGPQIRAVDAAEQSFMTVEGAPIVPGETYLETARSPERQEVYEQHTGQALWLLVAATVAQIAGVLAVGAAVPRVKKA